MRKASLIADEKVCSLSIWEEFKIVFDGNKKVKLKDLKL